MTKTLPFLFLILITSAITILTEEFLLNDTLIADYLDQQMSVTRIQEVLKLKAKWDWVNYLLIPVIYLIKFTFLSLWMLCGCLLFYDNQTLETTENSNNLFGKIFAVVIKTEFIFIIPSVITLAWFGLIDTDYTLVDLQYFKALSILNFFEVDDIEIWLIFPLQSLNLFEILYMFVLAIGIKNILKKDYNTALNFTIPVYGMALITWIVFISFLSINLTA